MKPRGITNAQAKLLAALCRDLGERYPGNGMSCLEASACIDALLERKRSTVRRVRSEYAVRVPF